MAEHDEPAERATHSEATGRSETDERDGRAVRDGNATHAAHVHQHLQNQRVNDECFVCGSENPAGLHGQFVEDEETGELVGIFTARHEHLSYPGRVHGGVASAMLDETIGRAFIIGHPDLWGVTMKLETRFHRPTPLGEPLYCRAHVTKETRRTFEGEGRLETADGTLCVSGRATYYICPVEKILADMGEDGTYVWDPDPREIPDGLFDE